ncbi:hypothetical protein [Paenibacillus segetis]|uniref:Uncharacterized protein n=1 Tax=Paenibacillus segetis TaxID=1325360 RepID=A0ABQ1YAF7_9BACL|nr:hypothetical protein [Paenibacillus segetis]GGH17009.1 hypothetical protein GCM10008013_12170 [Paenibacillus segetis]
MDIKQLEAEARFVARNAKHNMKLILRNPEMIVDGKMNQVMADLKGMDKLHTTFEAQKENARRLGRTSLRTRLKYLFVSIVRVELRKGKRETA